MEHPRTIWWVLSSVITIELLLTANHSAWLKLSKTNFQLNHASAHMFWSVNIWTQSTIMDRLDSAATIQSCLLPFVHIGTPKKGHTTLLDVLVHHCGLQTSKNLRTNSNKDAWRRQQRSNQFWHTANLLSKLTNLQLHLWCVQVPLPNVALTIVAARAIPNKISSNVLVEYQLKILYGLINQKIQVISSASDGSATERSMQQKLTTMADWTREYRIRHPKPTDPKNPDIRTSIPVFKGQCVVMVRDVKHAAKTARNNVTTGAKLLTLGNYIAMYSQVQNAVFANDGPLYHWDIEKVDHQDDNAACCLLSASTLNWFNVHCSSSPENEEVCGLIVYLFLMGEVVDAYQSWTLPLAKWVRMVLRLHFFLECWAQFLDWADYPKSNYFVSGQFQDILNYLIFGLVQLIIVYRDTYSSRFPLLPWLNSTKVCEHVFGVIWSLFEDFTMFDFYHLAPKLFIRLQVFTKSSLATVGKDTALGYTHTYSDCRGIDLTTLSTFPIDEEMNEAVWLAYEDTDELFFILGVLPDVFIGPAPGPTTTPALQHTNNLKEFNEDNADAEELTSETDAISYLYECTEQLKTSTLSPNHQKQIRDLSYASLMLYMHKDISMWVKTFVAIFLWYSHPAVKSWKNQQGNRSPQLTTKNQCRYLQRLHQSHMPGHWQLTPSQQVCWISLNWLNCGLPMRPNRPVMVFKTQTATPKP